MRLAGWTLPEWAAVVTIISLVGAVLARWVVRPQLRRAVEEGIASERGIQAAIRAGLPELAQVVPLKLSIDRLTAELATSAGHHREMREFVNDFTDMMRLEMRALATRMDEETRLNEEHRNRNAMHVQTLRAEIELAQQKRTGGA